MSLGGGVWNTECGCGAPATKKLCAIAYCDECAEAILAPIRERVAAREPQHEPTMGIGIQAGSLRPDWGNGWADLICDVCDATWVGPLGEWCAYCERWLELANDVQRDQILHPELPDPDDQRYDKALEAWGKRIADAVEAEIITAHEAQTALQRQERAA